MKLRLFISLILCSFLAASAKDSSVYKTGEGIPGDRDYTNFREPVIVKTNSGKLILGCQAGNRLSWPERSGQDLVIRISPDQGRRGDLSS